MPSLVSDVWAFLNERKKWWLLPIAIILFCAGVLIIVGQSSIIPPLIYALF